MEIRKNADKYIYICNQTGHEPSYIERDSVICKCGDLRDLFSLSVAFYKSQETRKIISGVFHTETLQRIFLLTDGLRKKAFLDLLSTDSCFDTTINISNPSISDSMMFSAF